MISRRTRRRIPAALAAGTLAISLSGCLIEAERPNIWLQNNSSQSVTLQMHTDHQPAFKVTAEPHTTQRSNGSPPKGHCYTTWEIVDTSGMVLKKLDKVCAYDTVVYP